MLRLTHSADLRKKNRGFTLIELIVVIVIIGILAAIAIVGYNAIIANSKKKALNASATQVAKILQGESAASQTAITAGGTAFTARLLGSAATAATLGGTASATALGLPSSVTTNTNAVADLVSAFGPNYYAGTATANQIAISDALTGGNTCTITLSGTVGATNTVSCP